MSRLFVEGQRVRLTGFKRSGDLFGALPEKALVFKKGLHGVVVDDMGGEDRRQVRFSNGDVWWISPDELILVSSACQTCGQMLPLPVIVINNYRVEFLNENTIKVGCTEVTKDQVKDILARLENMEKSND